MQYQRLFTLIILSLFTLSACQFNGAKEREALLMKTMTGSFDSEAQSLTDSTYFNISLHMYPIWQESGENWLYVEQALASTQDRPYRQRVYKVEAMEKGLIRSSVYTLKDQEQFIGQWKNPAFFDQFNPESVLTERTGCAVILGLTESGIFEGSTEGKGCESTINGASYASSSVKVFDNRIESWDQGWDVHGNQVWGATKGGYVFDKKTAP